MSKQLFDSLIATTTAFECSNPDELTKWQESNKDAYGRRCVTYAIEWARLMQLRMSQGQTVAECARETSHIADYDGITGFMYGAAVAMLSRCWKHGEELRRWHNLDTQIGNEGEKANESGGVLNPAVINIGN